FVCMALGMTQIGRASAHTLHTSIFSISLTLAAVLLFVGGLMMLAKRDAGFTGYPVPQRFFSSGAEMLTKLFSKRPSRPGIVHLSLGSRAATVSASPLAQLRDAH